MKKNTLLLVIIAIAIAATFIAIQQDLQFHDHQDSIDLLLPEKISSSLDKLEKVSITANNTTINLVKHQDTWTLAQQHNYPINTLLLRNTLTKLMDSKLIAKKTNDSTRLAKLGLAPEQASKLELFTNSNGTAAFSLSIGNTRANKNTYVRVGTNELQSYLASGDLTIDATINNWLDTSILDISSSEIHKITISHNNKPKIAIVKQWRETQEFEVIKGNKASLSNVNKLARALEKLTLETVKPLNSQQDKQLTVITKVQTFDGRIITSTATAKGDEYWVSFNVAFNEKLIATNKPQPKKTKAEGKDTKDAAKKTPTAVTAAQPNVDIAAVSAGATQLNNKLNGWQYKISADKYRVLVGDINKPQKDKAAKK
jgi:hypothetical protein